MALSDLSVGEVARRSGVAVSTVHFYEAKGLIEGWRTSGNQRRYDRSVLRKIAVIQVAQRAGLPLKTIGEYLGRVPSGTNVDARSWQDMARSWATLLDDRIKLLGRLRDELDGCIGCGCLSLKDCPLRNPDDELGKLGSGAVRLTR